MKSSFALLLSLTLLSGSATAQTRHNFTITVESVAREFIVARPSTAPPAGGYPVVMMFHGSSGTGQQFYNTSGWKEIGEEENFITVFPSGLEYCTVDSSGNRQNETKWHIVIVRETAQTSSRYHYGHRSGQSPQEAVRCWYSVHRYTPRQTAIVPIPISAVFGEVRSLPSTPSIVAIPAPRIPPIFS